MLHDRCWYHYFDLKNESIWDLKSKIKFYKNNVSFSVRRVEQTNARILPFQLVTKIKHLTWSAIRKIWHDGSRNASILIVREKNLIRFVYEIIVLVLVWRYECCMNTFIQSCLVICSIICGPYKRFSKEFLKIYEKRFFFSYFKWHYRLLKYFQRSTS